MLRKREGQAELSGLPRWNVYKRNVKVWNKRSEALVPGVGFC